MITNYLQLLLWLLALMGGAVLSCWIAYSSTVVQELKLLIGLGEQSKLPKWKPFMKPIGWLWKELHFMINCPYCSGYHLGWTITYFMFGFTLIQSLIYGAIVIIFVELYRKATL